MLSNVVLSIVTYGRPGMDSGSFDRDLNNSHLGSYDRSQFEKWVNGGEFESFIESVKKFFDEFFDTIYNEDLRGLALYLFNCIPAFIRGFVCILFILMIIRIIDYHLHMHII